MSADSAVQIRRGTIVDAEGIASVLRASFAEFKPLYTLAAFEATTPTADQIRARWDEGPVWAAVNDAELVGTGAAVPKASGLYVRSMAVQPAARGQGIAMQILKKIESFAIEYQHKHLFLRTTPFLNDAIRLYERFGFRRTDEGPYDLFGTPLFTMVKELITTDSK